uniref:Uncharacterized protein n=1 Tax=Plectus sambesii TaxID=2011161 RepID=A0A914W2T9_9BILA
MGRTACTKRRKAFFSRAQCSKLPSSCILCLYGKLDLQPPSLPSHLPAFPHGPPMSPMYGQNFFAAPPPMYRVRSLDVASTTNTTMASHSQQRDRVESMCTYFRRAVQRYGLLWHSPLLPPPRLRSPRIAVFFSESYGIRSFST